MKQQILSLLDSPYLTPALVTIIFLWLCVLHRRSKLMEEAFTELNIDLAEILPLMSYPEWVVIEREFPAGDGTYKKIRGVERVSEKIPENTDERDRKFFGDHVQELLKAFEIKTGEVVQFYIVYSEWPKMSILRVYHGRPFRVLGGLLRLRRVRKN